MSVKELKLTTNDIDLEIETELDCLKIGICSIDGYEVIYLNRSQAHLLMLYLQEHLVGTNERG